MPIGPYIKIKDIDGESESRDTFQFRTPEGGSSNPQPIEEISLNYTKVTWDAEARIEVQMPDLLISSYSLSDDGFDLVL